MPSFVTCNLGRDYELDIRLGLSWSRPPPASGNNPKGLFARVHSAAAVPQVINLPLHFSSIEVYSGLTPPAELVEVMRRSQTLRQQQRRRQQPPPSPQPLMPALPPRPAQQLARPIPQPPVVPTQTHDPLYPPQLAPGQAPHDDAPPSYDEAMAEAMTGPVFPDGVGRPAYSGVTNENAPSLIPENG
jgi:hypothetical protein